MLRYAAWTALLVFVGIPLGIQLVPYRVQTPPVTLEPDWDTTQTQEIAKRVCYDCHSNETRVPWYGHVAPFAWLVRSHVDEGRAQLNFSEMDRPQHEAGEAAEMVRKGQMPPSWYVALHPHAELSPDDRHALSEGLEATFGETTAAD